MAPSQRFANYPGAKEAPEAAFAYDKRADHNPVLRGLPLVIASNLVSYSGYVQRWFWNNAEFGIPKFMPGLGDAPRKYLPNVIPLAEGAEAQAMIPVGPELTEQRPPADLPGRFYTVADYTEAYKSGKLTPLQVVKTLLPLIRRDVEKQSKYANAWIQSKPDEVLAAARASTERWAVGKPIGVLDGVPFGVKDDTPVKGYVSTMGMKVNKAEKYFNTPATETAWPAQKLMDAGAIMLGKMNQHEVGMDTSGCNPSTGTATNWANPAYYPGGSSSGGASALSGGVVPIALGSDAGGSMRIPPAFCGVYGLKTTYNRTMTRNSSMAIFGPMAATVSDLTIAYRLVSQPDPSDPNTSLFAVSKPPSPSAKKYLGIYREWIERSDADVLQTFDKALVWLSKPSSEGGGGYEVVDIKIPYLRQAQLAHGSTCLAEFLDEARARSNDPKNFLHLLNYPNRIFVSIAQQTPAEDYMKYAQLRGVIMQHLAHLYETYPGMLIFTPTVPIAGWLRDPADEAYGLNNANITLRNMTYAWLANTSGCPAVTCPGGYVEPGAGEGKLPVGLMAVSEWGGEESLLSFAKDTERYLNEVYEGGRVKGAGWLDVFKAVKEGSGAGKGDEVVVSSAE
ncbi:fatty acid amide hydrolase [Rhypophila decipiens]